MATATVVVRAGDGSRYTYQLPIANPSGFAFGVTVGANDDRYSGSGGTPSALQWSYNQEEAALGRDFGQHVKFFGSGSGGITKAVQMWQASPGHEPSPLLTSEVFDLNAWSSFFDTLTSDVRVCYKQEFSQWLRTASASAVADYNAKMLDLRQMIDGHSKGHFVRLQFVGAEFQERDAANKGEQPIWRKLDPLPNCIVGCDCYVTTLGLLNDPPASTKATVDWFTEWSQQVPGTRLGISEGAPSRTVTGFTVDKRIWYVRTLSDYLESVDPYGSYNYWATDNSVKEGAAHDYSLNKPGDENFAAAVASLIRG